MLIKSVRESLRISTNYKLLNQWTYKLNHVSVKEYSTLGGIFTYTFFTIDEIKK